MPAIPSRLYLSELLPEDVPEATEALELCNIMESDGPSVKTSAGRGHKTLGPTSNLALFATEVCLDVATCDDVA